MANFSNAVENFNTPGYWQGDIKMTMYVPDATEQMSLAELQNGVNEIQIRIDKWKALMAAPVYWSSASRANVDFIISMYEDKKIGYQYLIEAKTPQTTTTTTVDPVSGEVVTVEKKSNWGLALLGGAALIFFILKKNKKLK